MDFPQHIVIIPDGNRRWAKKKGLPSFFGHREGVKVMEKVLNAALDMKIPYITVWGSSPENISKRSRIESKFLLKIFERNFKKLAKDEKISRNKVKIDVLGQWEKLFPEKLKNTIKDAIKRTQSYNNYHLTFLMAYSGQDEMEEAIRKMVDDKCKKVTKEAIKENLLTKNLPAVDLVLRTGTEDLDHWSKGLMMWDVAEARLYFTKTLWPDFSIKEFKKAIGLYLKTERRNGK